MKVYCGNVELFEKGICRGFVSVFGFKLLSNLYMIDFVEYFYIFIFYVFLLYVYWYGIYL